MRRALFVGVLFAALAAGIGVACTFPEVTFTSADGGASSGASSSGKIDTNPPQGDGSAPALDAAIVNQDPDAGHVVSDDECLTKHPPCDCDEDGWADQKCVDAGPATGYDAGLRHWDCDDRITNRHPDAGFQQVAMPTGRPGVEDDWDCDGRVDRFYGQYSCRTATVGVGLSCTSSVTGFLNNDVVPCGTKQPGWSCPTGNIGTCQGQEGPDITQACK